jgi:CheY-like chemotaxis protein
MTALHAMLVDDDTQALETMGLILEMDNYRVSTVPDGLQALLCLEKGDESLSEVDFLVIDLDMQNLSGIELLAEIRKRGYEIPVMVVTGYASKGTVVELLRKGVTDFLDKPIHVEEFRMRVNRLAEEAIRRRNPAAGQRGRSRIVQPFRASSVLDLARAGVPYSVRRSIGAASASSLVLAERKPHGLDILLADVEGTDSESFYASVLVKTCFDRWRKDPIGGREFLATLNGILLGGSLKPKQVCAVFLRIHTAEKRVDAYLAGYSCWAFMGLGGPSPKSACFQGEPLGASKRRGHMVVEFPYVPGDRFFILPGRDILPDRDALPSGESGDSAESGWPWARLRENILCLGGEDLDNLTDDIWTELGGSEYSGQPLPASRGEFLLGLELP